MGVKEERGVGRNTVEENRRKLQTPEIKVVEKGVLKEKIIKNCFARIKWKYT